MPRARKAAEPQAEPEQTCSTCAHWQPIDNRPVDHPLGRCAAHSTSRGKTEGKRAFALDVAQMHAEFRTQPDFGCLDWSE
jgi:hypothetical protein